jgi:hypothetical protein
MLTGWPFSSRVARHSIDARWPSTIGSPIQAVSSVSTAKTSAK